MNDWNDYDAEIILYSPNGQMAISLNQLELSIIAKALGWTIQEKNSLTGFAPNVLQRILNGKFNPFNVEIINKS